MEPKPSSSDQTVPNDILEMIALKCETPGNVLICSRDLSMIFSSQSFRFNHVVAKAIQNSSVYGDSSLRVIMSSSVYRGFAPVMRMIIQDDPTEREHLAEPWEYRYIDPTFRTQTDKYFQYISISEYPVHSICMKGDAEMLRVALSELETQETPPPGMNHTDHRDQPPKSRSAQWACFFLAPKTVASPTEHMFRTIVPPFPPGGMVSGSYLALLSGNTSVVQFLLDELQIPAVFPERELFRLNAFDPIPIPCHSLLHAACWRKDPDLVRSLLYYGYPFPMDTVSTPLHMLVIGARKAPAHDVIECFRHMMKDVAAEGKPGGPTFDMGTLNERLLCPLREMFSVPHENLNVELAIGMIQRPLYRFHYPPLFYDITPFAYLVSAVEMNYHDDNYDMTIDADDEVRILCRRDIMYVIKYFVMHSISNMYDETDSLIIACVRGHVELMRMMLSSMTSQNETCQKKSGVVYSISGFHENIRIIFADTLKNSIHQVRERKGYVYGDVERWNDIIGHRISLMFSACMAGHLHVLRFLVEEVNLGRSDCRSYEISKRKEHTHNPVEVSRRWGHGEAARYLELKL